MNINNTLRARKLNSYKSDKRPKVEIIVIHDTAGSGTVGDARYLANDPEGRGVSVDYVILRDGEIFKLNPDLTRYTTNHAGRRTSFKGRKNQEVNAHSIGIELAHNVIPARHAPEWPSAQVIACAELCKDLCAKFSLTKEDITTHKNIITDGSRSDPRNFPWLEFWALFDNNEESPIKAPDGRVYHTVIQGDTMFALANLYNTTIEKLKALNHYDSPSTLITVGQKLLVRE